MRVIGLDIGTTTICAVAVDSDSGELLRAVTVPNDTAIAGEGYEKLQSPMLILKKCTALVQQLREAFDPIVCIGVTGQMHGILYYDKAGNAVSPLYTWQDGTGALEQEDGTFASVLARLTGYPAASGFGLCTYFAHSRLGRVPAGCAGICTIHDYVAMHLAGLRRPLCHTSDAASLGLFNTDTLEFDTQAVERAGLDAQLLAPVTADFDVVGETADGVAVSVAIGDNQASFLGSVSDMRRDVLVNMGTGGQVSFLSGTQNAGELERRPIFGQEYILVGASLCGGSAFAMLENFLRQTTEMIGGSAIDSAYGAIDRFLAASARPDDPLLVDTRFCGTRRAPALRGSITGIDPANFTPAHLIWGMLDGIVTELWELYDGADHPHHARMVCSGNGLRKNPALRRAFAARFGAQAVLPAHTEEAAFGAALFAMTAGGVCESIDDAQKLIRYTEGE